MPRRRLLAILLAACCAAAPAVADEPGELSRYRFEQRHMGAPWVLVLYAADEQAANAAAEAAYARIAALDAVLSDYNPESELSRLSRTAGSGEAIPLGDDLWAVLRLSQDLSKRSGGAFDATVGPLVRLWRRARRMREMPKPGLMSAAREATGYQHLELDDERRTARLLKPGMRLDLGGIAMGYAVDEALQVLRERGVTRAILDASGDIGAGDPPPGEEGWRVGIVPLDGADGPPTRYVLLANAALTNSGDAFQFVEIDGVRYSHIIDPHTGLGLTDRSSVTVLAQDCTTADSLATAVSVLGPERGLSLVEETPGAAAIVVRRPDGEVEIHESSRLGEYRIIAPAAAPR